jgi:hypothetical protein
LCIDSAFGNTDINNIVAGGGVRLGRLLSGIDVGLRTIGSERAQLTTIIESFLPPFFVSFAVGGTRTSEKSE